MTARCYIGPSQGDESEKTYPSGICATLTKLVGVSKIDRHRSVARVVDCELVAWVTSRQSQETGHHHHERFTWRVAPFERHVDALRDMVQRIDMPLPILLSLL